MGLIDSAEVKGGGDELTEVTPKTCDFLASAVHRDETWIGCRF